MITFTPHFSSSAGNLYTVSDGSSTLLLECGVRIEKIRRALNHRLSSIDACLVTHEHGDHARAARDLLGAGVDVYCSSGTAQAFEIDCHHRVHIIEALKPFKIGPWAVIPFPVEHDAKEPLGFFVVNGTDRLVFAADTAYIRHRFAGITHVCLECNYSRQTMAPDIPLAHRLRIIRSHMSLDTVLAFLAANDLSGVRQIHLLHASRDNSDVQLFKDRVQAATGIPTYIAPE